MGGAPHEVPTPHCREQNWRNIIVRCSAAHVVTYTSLRRLASVATQCAVNLACARLPLEDYVHLPPILQRPVVVGHAIDEFWVNTVVSNPFKNLCLIGSVVNPTFFFLVTFQWNITIPHAFSL